MRRGKEFEAWLASMRPGQQRPGNSRRRLQRTTWLICFNEAGATTPRKLYTRGAAFGYTPRFNEAGATTPRKRRGWPTARARERGFNEAGATTPRKPPWPGRPVTPLLASMRPGQQRPGNWSRGDSIPEFRVASMRPGQQRPGNLPGRRARWSRSRGFNEAGATTPRKQGTPWRTRNREARFNEAGATTPRKLGDAILHGPTMQMASMRPGQQRPGNPGALAIRQLVQMASMRPGQQRPGNIYLARRRWRGWRRFNEAGATTPRKQSRSIRICQES